MPHLCEATNCHDKRQFSFFSGFVSVLFTCKLIHLFDDLFRASHLNHRLSEGFVADESVVDAVILLFRGISLQVDSPYGTLCIIPVTVWTVFSDVEVRMEKVSSTAEMYFRFSTESFVIRCPHVQYIIPVLQCLRHTLHCHFGSTLIISHSSVFPAAMIANLDSSLKGLND